MIKLREFTSWLYLKLFADDPGDQASSPELLRALRESGGQLGNMLKSKSGPGGGIDANPERCALVLIAAMLGGRTRSLGRRTLYVWDFGIRDSGSGVTFRFGEILSTTLGITALASDISCIMINSANRVAIIQHRSARKDQLYKPDDKEDLYKPRTALSRTISLDGAMIKEIAELLQQFRNGSA